MNRAVRTIWCWLPWALPCVIMCVLVAIDPHSKSVLRIYSLAVERFFEHAPLHDGGIHGFLYLPVFSLVFAPFHALGPVGAGVLWRLVGCALLAIGVWRLAGHLLSERRGAVLFWSGILIAAGSWDALRNGQANLWIAALLLHAALDLKERRLGRSALGLTVALAVKPIAIVPWLLLAGLEWRLIPRLAVGLLVLFGLPFLFGEPGYVWQQYEGFVAKLTRANTPAKPYTDLFGGLQQVGLVVPHALRHGVRLVAALITLAICLRARRRAGPEQAALTAMSLAAAYLMVFNPVTEANSYIILAAVVAPQAAAAWLAGRRREGVILAVGCVLRTTHEFRGPVHAATKRWLKPLLALAYGVWITLQAGRAPSAAGAPAAAPGSGRPAAED